MTHVTHGQFFFFASSSSFSVFMGVPFFAAQVRLLHLSKELKTREEELLF